MKRSVALLVSVLLLASCASGKDKKAGDTPAPSGNPYTSGSDSMPVGAIPAATLHDAQRNRDVEFSIEYPTKNGPYPVLIFSPEYGGSRAGYVGLSSYWAGHGYVVVKMSHADAGATRAAIEQRMEERRAAQAQQQQGGRRRRNQPQASQEPPPAFRADPAETWQSQTPANWQDRVADVRFVIDSLPRIVEQFPEIKERVDQTKVGVGGHSYGALTAILAGGPQGDPRIRAIAAMSPPGPSDARGITRDRFTGIRIPSLFLTGSRDLGTTENEDTAWRKQGFELLPAGDKWLVVLQGAGRSAFTGAVPDFGGYGPDRPMDMPYPTNRPPTGGNPSSYPQSQQPNLPNRGMSVFSTGGAGNVRTISLAFWDTYLKGDEKGREFMNKLKTRGDVEVVVK